MKTTLLLAICAAGALLSTGCSNSHADERLPGTVVEAPKAPNTFQIENPERFELATAESQRLHDDLLANGVVSPDVSRTVPVNSLSGGRVLEIRARLGDDVQKGQVLLVCKVADLAAAISDYQKAIADEALAKRAWTARRRCSTTGRWRRRIWKAPRTRGEGRSGCEGHGGEDPHPGRQYGYPDSHPGGARAGFRHDRRPEQSRLRAGVKSLDNSPNLFTIADLSQVWVICDVYENNLAQVRLGDFAEVRLAAYPDRVLRGTREQHRRDPRPGDPDGQGPPGTAKTERGLLRPGMFATATFVSGRPRHGTSFVPASAILRLHDKDWVFRPAGGNRFRRVEVTRARRDGRRTRRRFSPDMRPGDRVVPNALQFSSTVEQQVIRELVDFALATTLLVLGIGLLLLIWGAISFHNLPVEAYPDVANNYVQVITQWPGRAAEEVEQQVTIPIEIADERHPASGQHLRSISMFGLSSVTMIFDDESDERLEPQKVLERLSQVDAAARPAAADRARLQPGRPDLLLHADQHESADTT